MNKAYNLHVYCKNSDVVKHYLCSLETVINALKDTAMSNLEDGLYCSAELYINHIKVIDALREKLLQSYEEIKALGLEVEDNDENESEATDD